MFLLFVTVAIVYLTGWLAGYGSAYLTYHQPVRVKVKTQDLYPKKDDNV